MNKTTFIALIEAVLEDKIKDISVRSRRGPRGLKGDSFSFEDHKDIILGHLDKVIENNYEQYKLHFSDLTEEERESLKLKFTNLTDEEKKSLRGGDGKPGEDGKDFSFEENKIDIENIILSHIEKFKLKFEDLTEEEKDSLKIRGPRGQRGKGFNFEENREEIEAILSDVFNKTKEELKLKFSDLSDNDIDKLKLKFSDLNEEEKDSLKVRGPRGQRGKSIKGDRGNTISVDRPNDPQDGDLYLDAITGDINKYEFGEWVVKGNIKGPQGLSIRGVPGVQGLTGRPGINGLDGKDAPTIVDVELEVVNKDMIYFIFTLSDGKKLETNTVTIPSMKAVLQSYYSIGSSGGGTSVPLEIQKDGAVLGNAEKIDFVGANIDVTWSEIDKKATVSVTGSAGPGTLTIHDEGIEISDQVTDINFTGSAVKITASTVISQWLKLSDVTSMADYITGYPTYVTVEVSDPSKFSFNKEASEPVVKLECVRMDSQTTVRTATNDTYTNAKVTAIAINSGNTGALITCLLFGILEDNSFNFPINEPL